MKRALVIGGGGIVGMAWETALLAGLMDGGVDLRNADLIVGTSAGSIVGLQIAGGRDPRELLAERDRPQDPPPGRMPTPAEMAPAFRTWASFDEMTPDACAAVGQAALATPTMTEAEYLARWANWDSSAWPDKHLLVVAVDCESGDRRAFDSASGASITLAIGASCSVPGMFPPVTIDGRRYTDGGVASSASCDLAARIEPDVVLVIAPMGGPGSRLGEQMARRTNDEIACLEAAGARVTLVQFDDATRAALGGGLMDPAAAAPAAEAGRAQGLRIAAEVSSLWN